MSKYEYSHEEEREGTYHRREVDCRPRSPVTTTTTTSYPVTTRYIERHDSGRPSSRQLAKQHGGDTSDDEDNFQEWTTSKRKVNHKTRQVETRVSRQLLVRGGEVIADSGPQVTTRIKEDNKVEECEKEKTPKNKSRFEALENAPEAAEASGLVLGEKKEVQRVSREVREENMQYHDERFKELTGKDVHRRAIQAPHELITINDKAHSASSKPRGKMIHYSNKGKKYQDTDEILEVAKLAIDGSVTKEVKRTKHHEEFSEDELPDEKGEAEQLKRKPVVERSSRRHADYVNDFDEADAPVVPRYEIDPLLNSLRDEDFRPRRAPSSISSGHDRRVPVVVGGERNSSRRSQLAATSSSDEEEAPRRSTVQRSHSPSTRVEIPEMYRVKKTSSKLGQSNKRREDAGTQARLTDEEVERNSLRSASPSVHSHEKATRYLQRQSTPNSSRRYYYGDSQRMKQQAGAKKRPTSLSSSSSTSSLSSELEARTRRKHGAQSRDSGFKSPQSNKSSERPGAVSPTSQRSVKTTTRTLSAGLADREEGRSKSRASDKTTTVSLCSPNVTKINVPYRRIITIEREPNFTVHHNKYRATPVLVDMSSSSAEEVDDDDRMSQGSSCSLQSARTYNIRKLEISERSQQLENDNKTESTELKENYQPKPIDNEQTNIKTEPEFDENGNGKATAWIFDPRDNSSTAIVAPPKPARPETPKVDAKTEELDQRRGGRSYYLELVEPEGKAQKRTTRPSSIDSLYSRWNSYGALNRPFSSTNARAAVPKKTTKTTSQTALADPNNGKGSAGKTLTKRRQLPFSGPPSSLGDRSKSSSCLLSVTKPSKYSIYGGFRKPGEGNKPVPRLSYSRAIGPRSTRVDTTPTAPSRYLKMR